MCKIFLLYIIYPRKKFENFIKGVRIMKKIRKILALALTIFMLVGLMPGNVFAEDTRTKINNIVATSDTNTIPGYGKEVKKPTFNVTQGSPAYFDKVMCSWRKKDGTRWVDYKGTAFTEGTYCYGVQVRIDGEEGKTHVLDSKGVTVTVDGYKWADNVKPNVGDDFSYFSAKSKEYIITAPVGVPLDFVKNESWNIPLNYVGKAIETFLVAAGVAGGKKPYTFSKASGPDWINVAGDGTVSGTPTSVGTNKDLVIRVTDNASATEEITLTVANTVPDPSNRTKINNIVATSDTNTIPGYGKEVKKPTFNVTQGSPAYFDKVMCSWRKKDGTRWVDYKGTAFTEGTYCYGVQVRIDGEEGKTHVLDSKGVTVTVDGYKWADNVKPNVGDDFSYFSAKSKEYVITETSTETAIEIPKANTNLVYTGNPQTGVNEGTGYTLTDNTATDAGTYTAKATLKAGYKWRDGSTVVKNISFEIKKARPTFTEPTGLKGQKGAKLSTVTLPSGFTWVDGDITLSTVGDNTFKAKFTPDDTNNYKEVEVDIKVLVEEVTPPALTVTAISVNSTNHKTEYKVDEPLDVKDLTIEATKSDGTKDTVPVTAGMISDFDTSTAGTKTVTITYQGQTTTFNINVTAAPTPPVTVTSIKVNSTNHKTEYKVDEPLDVKDLTIEATKSDGTKDTVPVTAGMISDFDTSTAGTKTVTITYQGQTTTYNVTVTAGSTPPPTPTVASIAVNSADHKTNYTKGEPLDVSNLTILVTMSNGETRTENVTAGMVSGFDKNTEGTQTLIITYEGQTTTYNINVTASSTPPTPTPTPDPYYPGYYDDWYEPYRPYKPHRPYRPAEDKKTEEKPEEKPIDKPANKVETEVIFVIGSNNMDTKINGADSFKGMDAAPYIKNGRTMLPIRYIAEALGMSVSWDAKTRTVIIGDLFYTVEIPVDTNIIKVNGEVFTSDVKPEIVHGRTMMPIANIARALGLKDGKDIIWDASKRQVIIKRIYDTKEN